MILNWIKSGAGNLFVAGSVLKPGKNIVNDSKGTDILSQASGHASAGNLVEVDDSITYQGADENFNPDKTIQDVYFPPAE